MALYLTLNSGLPVTYRYRLEKKAAKKLEDLFQRTARQLAKMERVTELASVWELLRSKVEEILRELNYDVYIATANHNGATGVDAIVQAELFSQNEAVAKAPAIVAYTKEKLTRSLQIREALFNTLVNLLGQLFGKPRVDRIVITATTRAETAAIKYVAETLDVGEPGQLKGAVTKAPDLSAEQLLGDALARKPTDADAKAKEIAKAVRKGELKIKGKKVEKATSGGGLTTFEFSDGTSEIIATSEVEPRTIAAHEDRKFKVIWRLNPNCNHCTFCPLVAGTDKLFWERFVDGPPAHVNCCCNLEIVGADFKIPRRPSVLRVLAAAREIGLI